MGIRRLSKFPASGANDVIATADEPRHGVHRSLLTPGLSNARIEGARELIRQWTRQSLQPLLESGEGDFGPVTEIVPARAVAHVLGLPAEDAESFASGR